LHHDRLAVRAKVEIPHASEYPWRSILAGLAAADIVVSDDGHEDMLITWSPWVHTVRDHHRQIYLELGRPVLVIENGWLSPIQGIRFYQIALDGWNGTGRFPAGDDRRWASWGVRLAPWRLRVSGTALVIGQRGHPSDRRTMPPGWFESFMPDCNRRIVRRPRAATRPLSADLEDADVVHTWSSNAASWAVVAGVPVVQHGPNLMVGELASKPGEKINMGCREPVLERLAYAQWSAEEIETGEPFRRLLAAP